MAAGRGDRQRLERRRPAEPDVEPGQPGRDAGLVRLGRVRRRRRPGALRPLMAADLALPANQYWWIDAMFMGLPLWPRWAARTGAAAYGAKHGELYAFLKTDGATTWRQGCTDTGLFDATENLWWRDCKYVPARDALGHKVFWSRGNGWVLAAMARMLMVLPPSDPQAAEYRSMFQRMSARLAQLQGADGMWRFSLLSPSLYPRPETSGTALFTYAMAYGIRTGVLDAATYLPSSPGRGRGSRRCR